MGQPYITFARDVSKETIRMQLQKMKYTRDSGQCHERHTVVETNFDQNIFENEPIIKVLVG